MIYLDSSVILRWILDEPGQLDSLSVAEPLTSALAEVEIFRTLDRLRFRAPIEPEVLATLHASAYDLLSRILIIQVAPAVLARAAQPFPTPLRSLDAIHLATVLLWREQRGAQDIVVATHDQELGMAAKASGLSVRGV